MNPHGSEAFPDSSDRDAEVALAELDDAPVAGRRRFPILSTAVLTLVLGACAAYANLSFLVKNPADYRYFPPFLPHVNSNGNKHLGGEYYQMARALVAGEGFSHPFAEPTGPTAWQGPVLPAVLAAFLWATGDREGITAVVVVFQTFILILTGLLVVLLVRDTCSWIGAGTATVVYLAFVVWHFNLNFQFTHDCWINMLALDVLLAGCCWSNPLRSRSAAAGWGLLGGLGALLTPIVAFTWACLTLFCHLRAGARRRLILAVAVAGLVVAPWAIRNWIVFGRFIPIKSNLAYEMVQSQCLQKGGLLRGTTFRHHPFSLRTKEGLAYKQMGEVDYMDLKRRQLWESIAADPFDFLDRVAERFLGATLWYVPFWESRRPWVVFADRWFVHPLPFLALIALAFTVPWRPLNASQGAAVVIYASYLLPYVVTSYYDRYAVPLMGVKVLFLLWAFDRVLALLLRRR